MGLNDIPVRVMGPGSQPEEGEKLSYIDMPGDMTTYSVPLLPEPDEVIDLPDVREAMDWLKASLAKAGDGEPRVADLSRIDAESRELVNQILGEGEVLVTRTGDVDAKTQESVLAGVWRTIYNDADGNLVADLLEVADLPHTVKRAAEDGLAVDTGVAGVTPELPNVLPILTELAAHTADYRPGAERHSVNLSLLPMSEAELEFLDARLGRGPIDILSRAYGKCQVISAAASNLWWVRYYNSMGTLILNTLEVVDVPDVVAAAPEDLADSAKRLEQILEVYWPDAA